MGLAFAISATLAQAAPFAYVTHAGAGGGPAGNVSQYDATSGGLVPLTPPSVSIGNPPAGSLGVAVSPDGRDVYVTAQTFAASSGTLIQYAAGPDGALTLKSLAPVPPLALPGPLALSPDGQSLYAVDSAVDGSVLQYTVHPDGALSLKSPPLVPTGRPEPTDLAVSPDGRNVYVPSDEDTGSSVSQYTISADGTLSPKSPPTVPTREFPGGLAVSPDSRSVYVAGSNGTGLPGAISQFSVGGDGSLSPKSPPAIPAAGQPSDVAVSPDGKSAYVVSGARASPNGSVLQYAVGSDGALTPMSPASVAADTPVRIALNPDGNSVYVTDGNGSILQYTRAVDGTLSPKSPPTVPTGTNPVEIAVSHAPRLATTLSQCRNGGWQQFGFKNQGRCVAFVILSRICDALERHGIHLKFCPPALPGPTRGE